MVGAESVNASEKLGVKFAALLLCSNKNKPTPTRVVTNGKKSRTFTVTMAPRDVTMAINGLDL
jgi:hypothetical protein